MASNDRILVSIEEMNATIRKYESARSTLQQAYANLDKAKQHLDNCYKGAAYLVLVAKLTTIFLNVKSADRAIDRAVNGLKNTIATMEEAEGSVKSDVSSREIGTSAPHYLS